jgi:hypothetical protein
MMTMEERLELARRVDEAGGELSQELQDQVFEFQQELIDNYSQIANGLADAAQQVIDANRGQTFFGSHVRIPLEIFNGYVGLIEKVNKDLLQLLHLQHGYDPSKL